MSESQFDLNARHASASAATLGAQLKAARESRGIALRTVSDQTRISMRHLEAIEADDFKQLPGGIFNRSFVKTYARAVGFDEAQASELYAHTARAQGERDDNDIPISYTPQVYTDNNSSSRPPMTTIVLSFVILGILCYGVYALLHFYLSRTAAPETSPVQTSAQSVVAPTPQPTPDAAMLAENQPLTARLSSVGDEVSVTVNTDGNQQTLLIKPNDAPREITANQINLRYDRTRAAVLRVEVNGRFARVPVDPTKNVSEMIINRETFRELTQ